MGKKKPGEGLFPPPPPPCQHKNKRRNEHQIVCNDCGATLGDAPH